VNRVGLVLASLFIFVHCYPLTAGSYGDSTKTSKDTVTMREVHVVDSHIGSVLISHMNDVTSGAIYAGKKTELIKLENMTLNTATNNARQAYVSVAGLNIWESDGAGLQLGIGGRGLSPDRTSNFTVRQNGYDISADPLGYPESYYTPPLDFVQRIEIVRGGGALRFGTQFGGVVNFAMKQPNAFVPLAASAGVTVGSYGFLAGRASLSGTTNGLSYEAMYQYKRSDGWRPNSEFDMHVAYGTVGYAFTDRFRITADYTFMSYLAHQPGGLTDKQFETDPSVSLRTRNWFTVNWNLASLRIDYVLGSSTSFRSLFFGNLSGRTALGNLDRINMVDLGGPRTMIDGSFQNIGNETTITHDVELLGQTSTLVGGFRLFHGTTRQQQGDASDSSDADFRFSNPDDLEGSDYTYPNDNAAVFAEGLIRLSSTFSLVPGIRVEHITTRADGYYRVLVRDLAGNPVVDTSIYEDRSRSRTILLGGLGASWKFSTGMEMYGNVVQNYRSITFNDLRITNPNLVIDPNITDERGYTIDLGVRGRALSWLNIDASAFYLRYDDRIGEVLRSDQPPLYLPFRYRTNIADAYTTGLEAVANLDLSDLMGLSETAPQLDALINGSVIRGRYVAPDDPTIDGNAVEFVPPYTIRFGLSAEWKGIRTSLIASWVGEHFTDASNATYTASAVTGLIPAYSVMYLSIGYTWEWLKIDATVNNLLDASYFTRRATSYPGPGIIPAEPLSFFLTVSAAI